MTTRQELDAIMANIVHGGNADVVVVGRPCLGRVTGWLEEQGVDSYKVRTWFDDKEVCDADLCIVTAIDDWRRLKLYCTDRHEFGAIKEWDKMPEQLVFILKNEFRTLRLVELDALAGSSRKNGGRARRRGSPPMGGSGRPVDGRDDIGRIAPEAPWRSAASAVLRFLMENSPLILQICLDVVANALPRRAEGGVPNVAGRSSGPPALSKIQRSVRPTTPFQSVPA